MPFFVIRGTFHLVGRNQKGLPTGFQPDGDSIQFKPDDVAKLDLLRRRRRPFKLTGINSVNLRFEGIDAPELHFQGTRQPAPFAEDSRNFLTGTIGMNPITYKDDGITVKPPANDGQRGYILARELEANGRPVSFVFLGDPAEGDGASVTVGVARLKQSLNFKLIDAGQAYPLFYDSLFAGLRGALTVAADDARSNHRGVWQKNIRKRFTINSLDDAQNAQILYPKLFRRLSDFLKQDTNLGNFVMWMNDKGENDAVFTLPEFNRTHLDNVLSISGNTIKLKKLPTDLVFVSQ